SRFFATFCCWMRMACPRRKISFKPLGNRRHEIFVAPCSSFPGQFAPASLFGRARVERGRHMDLVDTSFQDLRHALRQLRKAPGFAFTAILTLALGIGATTAIFTLVYDVMLRPLPYSHPEQLVVLEEQVAEFRDIYPKLPMNANHFFKWQQNSQTLQSLALMEEASMPLGTGGHPLQVDTLRAPPGLFSVLDIGPQLGRPFTEQETQTGHEHVVLLTNQLWREQFQSDAGILGRVITLNGFP